MEFFKNNKKFFLYGVIPFILILLVIGFASKSKEEQIVKSGNAVNVDMPGAVIDSNNKSKADLYDEAKQSKDDPYKSNQSANVDFKLVNDGADGLKEEPSMEVQAKIEEINKKNREYEQNQQKMKENDFKVISSYQAPAPVQSAPQQQIAKPQINRNFNSVKVSESKPEIQTEYSKDTQENEPEGIQAVVLRNVKVSGSTPIVIRILEDISIEGTDISKNSVINGIATLSGDRINITLKGSSIQGKSVQYSFIAFDTDGLPGIRVDGSETGELARRTYSEQIRNVGSTVAGRLGTAGIIGSSVLNGISGGRSNRQKVEVAAGYKLLLKEF